jgi:hypothetical protein
VSKWRLEPFAPFDTAPWAYSGCSLRYGPLGLLRMLPSIRPPGPAQDAHSGFPPTCIRYLRGSTAVLSVKTAARGVSQSRRGSRRTLIGRRLYRGGVLSRSHPSIRPPGPTQDAHFDTAPWAYSGRSLRLSTDLHTLPSGQYCGSFGGDCGEGSLGVQARLKTHADWPKAVSRWRLEPFAPFHTLCYSGCWSSAGAWSGPLRTEHHSV